MATADERLAVERIQIRATIDPSSLGEGRDERAWQEMVREAVRGAITRHVSGLYPHAELTVAVSYAPGRSQAEVSVGGDWPQWFDHSDAHTAELHVLEDIQCLVRFGQEDGWDAACSAEVAS
jgi:hypothetical protein